MSKSVRKPILDDEKKPKHLSNLKFRRKSKRLILKKILDEIPEKQKVRR